ncbi:MAG: DUF1223 domain-containing protein [Novosphingobium sp.]
MIRRLLAVAATLSAALALAACSSADAGPPPPAAGIDAAHPLVLELFQSQGCSSCPPANANLNALADRPDVIALSFAVTYWDKLGWKDRFAQPGFTARQYAYAASGHSDGVYTPQVVLNGRSALVGSDRAVLGRAMAAAGAVRGGPGLSRAGDRLRIAAAPGQHGDILLVTYDPRSRDVPIRAGENSGRTLPHRNIVTDLRQLGTWSGAAQSLALPPPGDRALRRVVLIQQGSGGAIVAALRV